MPRIRKAKDINDEESIDINQFLSDLSSVKSKRAHGDYTQDDLRKYFRERTILLNKHNKIFIKRLLSMAFSLPGFSTDINKTKDDEEKINEFFQLISALILTLEYEGKISIIPDKLLPQKPQEYEPK